MIKRNQNFVYLKTNDFFNKTSYVTMFNLFNFLYFQQPPEKVHLPFAAVKIIFLMVEHSTRIKIRFGF